MTQGDFRCEFCGEEQETLYEGWFRTDAAFNEFSKGTASAGVIQKKRACKACVEATINSGVALAKSIPDAEQPAESVKPLGKVSDSAVVFTENTGDYAELRQGNGCVVLQCEDEYGDYLPLSLNRDQVLSLMMHLKTWLDTGRLA